MKIKKNSAYNSHSLKAQEEARQGKKLKQKKENWYKDPLSSSPFAAAEKSRLIFSSWCRLKKKGQE